jgi:hypothetical protein
VLKLIGFWYLKIPFSGTIISKNHVQKKKKKKKKITNYQAGPPHKGLEVCMPFSGKHTIFSTVE